MLTLLDRDCLAELDQEALTAIIVRLQEMIVAQAARLVVIARFDSHPFHLLQ